MDAITYMLAVGMMLIGMLLGSIGYLEVDWLYATLGVLSAAGGIALLCWEA